MRRVRRRRQRKSIIDFLLPFLLIVSVGIIGVIGVQIWSNWDKQGKADVYFYVAEGSAKILPYGETDWSNGFSGTKLLLGDALKTSSFGRVVLEFFNGTKVRMGRDTALTLTDVTKASDRETIELNLENGMLWLNGQKSAGVRESHYEVRSSHMQVKAEGTIFEVENNSVEAVRVFDGEVKVDIYVGSGGSEHVAETISVGVGQELILDDAALRAFEDNKSPSVLSAVSEDFKKGSWYRWNIQEDASPTDFSDITGGAVSDGALDEATTADEDASALDEEEDLSDEDTTSTDGVEEDVENNVFGDESSPDITEPSFSSTTDSSFIISGTVPEGTTKVEVQSPLGGTHVLSKFSEGDKTFSYNVSESLGNIEAGDNTYKVYAYDESGDRGTPSEITITFEKEKVDLTDSLTDPAVNTYNGSTSSEVSTDTVTIVGSIKGAEKVLVNGYQLSQFSPGDTSWTYVAKESLGNLVPGVNNFEVYGVDPDGNKSAVVKFTVTYNKAEGSTEEETETPVESSGGIEFGF